MLQLTTVFFFIFFLLLAGVHWLASTFFLYWKFPWFDIPVHFIGGVVAALGIFVLKDMFRFIPERFQYVGPVMAGVIIIVLGWELFELQTGLIAQQDYMLDTIIDVVVGTIGGFVGFLFGHYIRQF